MLIRKNISPQLVFFLSIIGLMSATLAQEAHIVPLKQSAKPQHLRVQFERFPDSEAVISWTTTVPGKNHVVYYDTEAQKAETEKYSHKSKNIHSGAYTLKNEEKSMESWYHHSYIKDLKPATTYYITVETDGEKLGEYHFITAPADNRPVSLLIGGDSRLGDDRIEADNPRRGMNSRMRRLLEENPGIIALAHSADYTNTGRWSELFYWLNDHFENTTTREGRLLPIFPSRGNHDLLVGFEEMFWWPNRKNDFYYTARLNKNTALVILNTEISINGDQRVWLKKQLKRLRPKSNWLMAMYHQPAFPSVRAYEDGEPRRRAWVPLFEKYQLDLVASGHDHSLKRSLPILNLKPDAKGIVYIGDGGLGVRPRNVDPERWYLSSPGLAKSTYNVHLIEYTSREIDIKAIGMKGELLDSFVIPENKKLRESHYSKLLNKVESAAAN